MKTATSRAFDGEIRPDRRIGSEGVLSTGESFKRR
jgi:hypothetical protein